MKWKDYGSPQGDMRRISGPSLVLRLVKPEDAGYIHGLRHDPAYNQHLSSVEGTVAQQRDWILAYKTREAAGTEYYYVIERHDGVRCGLVRLYDITPGHFTWGSWILDHNKPPKAALESAVLSFSAGFRPLSRAHAIVEVRRANTHAEAFYRRLSMQEIRADTQNIFFHYDRETFMHDQPGYLALLDRGPQ